MTVRTTLRMWSRVALIVRAVVLPLNVIGALLSVPASAAAQTPPGDQAPAAQPPADTPLPPPPPRRPVGQMKLGSWTVTPSMLLTNVGVDTNVLNSNGEPRSDFTATIGPVLDGVYKTHALTVEARATAGYVYYKTFQNQGGLSPTLLLATEYRLGPRITVFSNDQLLYVKDRPTVEVDTRSRRFTSDLGLGIGIGIARKFRLDLEQRFRKTEYHANAVFRGIQLRQPLNDRVTLTSGTLNYQLTPYTALRAMAIIERDQYPLTPIRDGHAHEYALGVQFNPRALLAGDVRVGYRVFRSGSPLQPDYHGAIYDGRVMYTLSDSTGLMAGMHRFVVPSYDLINPYFLATQYEGGLQQRLGRRFDTGVSYTYYDLAYRTLNTINAPKLPYGSNLERAYTGSVGLLTRRWGRYALYAQRWQRRYLLHDERNYDNLRFGFMITSTRWLTATSGFGRGIFLNAPGL